MTELNLLLKMIIWAVPVVFAITLHEVAHGITAVYFGDNTAKEMGRLTANPLKHIDPLGSIVIPIVMIWLSPFIFGWARPVPVNAQNLIQPGRDMIFVAMAGPLANFLMSLFWAFVMKVGILVSINYDSTGFLLITMGAAGVFINIAIMMLNLLPLPPLDGGRILIGLLPERSASWISKIEPFGLPILVVLIFAGLAGKIVWPLMVFGMAVSTQLTAVPVDVLTDALWLLFGGLP